MLTKGEGAIGSQRYPRTVPGRHLADELARCDAEIAEIKNRADVQAGLVPAWLVTVGIEDWEAEKRLIRKEAERTAAGGKGKAMLLLRLAWWETVRNLFDEDESAALACAVHAETIRPSGVYLDPLRLPRELREKVEGLLNGARYRTTNA